MNRVREQLEEERRANPFPHIEPFEDRAIMAEGWWFGSTLGPCGVEEVAAELNRMFGRDDFEDCIRNAESPIPDELRFMARAYVGDPDQVVLMFFIHPSKAQILEGYTSIMYFETMQAPS
jgi:hypothetical protein